MAGAGFEIWFCTFSHSISLFSLRTENWSKKAREPKKRSGIKAMCRDRATSRELSNNKARSNSGTRNCAIQMKRKSKSTRNLQHSSLILFLSNFISFHFTINICSLYSFNSCSDSGRIRLFFSLSISQSSWSDSIQSSKVAKVQIQRAK